GTVDDTTTTLHAQREVTVPSLVASAPPVDRGRLRTWRVALGSAPAAAAGAHAGTPILSKAPMEHAAAGAPPPATPLAHRRAPPPCPASQRNRPPGGRAPARRRDQRAPRSGAGAIRIERTEPPDQTGLPPPSGGKRSR